MDQVELESVDRVEITILMDKHDGDASAVLLRSNGPINRTGRPVARARRSAA